VQKVAKDRGKEGERERKKREREVSVMCLSTVILYKDVSLKLILCKSFSELRNAPMQQVWSNFGETLVRTALWEVGNVGTHWGVLLQKDAAVNWRRKQRNLMEPKQPLWLNQIIYKAPKLVSCAYISG
jgi:hypothetical protein